MCRWTLGILVVEAKVVVCKGEAGVGAEVEAVARVNVEGVVVVAVVVEARAVSAFKSKCPNSCKHTRHNFGAMADSQKDGHRMNYWYIAVSLSTALYRCPCHVCAAMLPYNPTHLWS